MCFSSSSSPFTHHSFFFLFFDIVEKHRRGRTTRERKIERRRHIARYESRLSSSRRAKKEHRRRRRRLQKCAAVRTGIGRHRRHRDRRDERCFRQHVAAIDIAGSAVLRSVSFSCCVCVDRDRCAHKRWWWSSSRRRWKEAVFSSTRRASFCWLGVETTTMLLVVAANILCRCACVAVSLGVFFCSAQSRLSPRRKHSMGGENFSLLFSDTLN